MGRKEKQGEREYKSFVFELKEADPESGEFSGYAAVFGNVDSGGDVIEKGAFAKTIKEDFDRIKILSQHNSSELPIGKPLELREDEKGLFIKGKISDTQAGRDIRTLLKDGVLTELSIGYDAVVYEIDEENEIRRLKEIKLWEVSIVTWAMNDQAKIDEVKSLAEELKMGVKAGKITRSKLNTLKPFIAIVKELVDILSPLLELSDPDQDLENEPEESEDPSQKSIQQTKASGVIIKIIPNKIRR